MKWKEGLYGEREFLRSIFYELSRMNKLKDLELRYTLLKDKEINDKDKQQFIKLLREIEEIDT